MREYAKTLPSIFANGTVISALAWLAAEPLV